MTEQKPLPVIPRDGTEHQRAIIQSIGGIQVSEVHSTTDQLRFFLNNVLISGGKYLGVVADGPSQIALNATHPRGCWPGDFCTRSDLSTLALCLTNNGALLTDWFIFSGSTPSLAWSSITSIPAAISALAALTPAANKIPYFDTTSSAALLPVGSVGASVLAATTTGAAQTAIGATTYTLPIATGAALGGVKVGSGLSIDPVTGILSIVVSFIGILLTLPFFGFDDFEGYSDGATSIILGLSWGGNAALVDVMINGLDDFESYSDGTTSFTSGLGYTGNGWGGTGTTSLI